jgi:hypothetical protein
MTDDRKPTPTNPRCARCGAVIDDRGMAMGRCPKCRASFTPRQVAVAKERKSSSAALSFAKECNDVASMLEKDGRPLCIDAAISLREMAAIFGSWADAPPIDDGERTQTYSSCLSLLRKARDLLTTRQR